MESQVLGDSLVVTTDRTCEGQVLKEFLSDQLRLPEGFVAEILREKRVTMGRHSIDGSHVLHAGERVRFAGGVIEDAGEGLSDYALDHPLNVLYEDHHALVVNKPRGLLVHPGSPLDVDTLAHRVAAHYRAEGTLRKVRHAHRLDKDTTGAILYAKHAYSARTFVTMIAQHEIARTYVAMVEGVPNPPLGLIDASIGRDRHVSGKYRVSPTGKTARTHYRTIASTVRNGRAFALIACRLETGRTHQIRVHLAHLGTPIVGDPLYRSGHGALGPFSWGEGYALHAASISFWHPYEGTRLDITAPFDEQFLTRSKSLGFGVSFDNEFLRSTMDPV